MNETKPEVELEIRVIEASNKQDNQYTNPFRLR